jgi:Icc-related predicted phosphoesterase
MLFEMIKKIIVILFVCYSSAFKPNKFQNFSKSAIKQDSIITVKNNYPITIVGDLQRTTSWELMIGREQNELERQNIIKNIASENPAALILLGDMVSDGSDIKEWNYLERLLTPIKNENIPIIPVLGNHEYWGDNNTALYNAGKYFPIFRTSHWYIKRYGFLAFIILDSNKNDLPDYEWTKERNWFENSIKYYDSDSTVKGIVVCLHHPPYTNSIVTGDDINVQEAFVQPFLNSSKTLAMISGHAHTYERFEKKGKMFIVSGGGGGPRVLLKTGLNENKDLVNLPPIRPFNYLLLYLKSDGIEIITKGLNKDSSNFFTVEDFSIPFNKISY